MLAALAGWHTIFDDYVNLLWNLALIGFFSFCAWIISDERHAKFLNQWAISFLFRHLFINYAVVHLVLLILIKTYSFFNKGSIPECPQGEKCIWDLAHSFINEDKTHLALSTLTIGAISDATSFFGKRLTRKSPTHARKNKINEKSDKQKYWILLIITPLIASCLVIFVPDSNYLLSLSLSAALVGVMIGFSWGLYEKWKKRLEFEAQGTDNTKGISTNERHDLYLLAHIVVGNIIFFFLYYMIWNDPALGKTPESCLTMAPSESCFSWKSFTDAIAYTVKIGEMTWIDDFNSMITPKFKAITLGQIAFNLIDIGVIILSFGARGNFLIGRKTEGPDSPNDPENNYGGGQNKKAEKTEEDLFYTSSGLKRAIDSLYGAVTSERKHHKENISKLNNEIAKLREELGRSRAVKTGVARGKHKEMTNSRKIINKKSKQGKRG